MRTLTISALRVAWQIPMTSWPTLNACSTLTNDPGHHARNGLEWGPMYSYWDFQMQPHQCILYYRSWIVMSSVWSWAHGNVGIFILFLLVLLYSYSAESIENGKKTQGGNSASTTLPHWRVRAMREAQPKGSSNLSSRCAMEVLMKRSGSLALATP